MHANDVEQLTPRERFGEIAAILARGVLRLRIRATSPSVKNSAKADLKGLELPGETRLSVRVG